MALFLIANVLNLTFCLQSHCQYESQFCSFLSPSVDEAVGLASVVFAVVTFLSFKNEINVDHIRRELNVHS